MPRLHHPLPCKTLQDFIEILIMYMHICAIIFEILLMALTSSFIMTLSFCPFLCRSNTSRAICLTSLDMIAKKRRLALLIPFFTLLKPCFV